MFGLGATEVIVILVIALIFIGPKKLPELAKGLGKGIREFQKAKDDIMNQVNDEEEVAEKVIVKETVKEAHDEAIKVTGVASKEEEPQK